LDDVFELQDQVASSVVAAIEPKLRQSEINRGVRKPTESSDAYGSHLQARAQLRQCTPEGSGEAIGSLRKALALDPGYAAAAGLFAWCQVFQWDHTGEAVAEVESGGMAAAFPVPR
jgi:hypothetical protein